MKINNLVVMFLSMIIGLVYKSSSGGLNGKFKDRLI